MSALTFDALRKANAARVGLFKNGRGHLAHKAMDGSDWTVAQWFQAMVGEIGEFAEVRNAFESGAIDRVTYTRKACKELPDSLIYHDLLCMRALDGTLSNGTTEDAATILMTAMEHIGIYANARKKFDRGDLSADALRMTAENELKDAIEHLTRLIVGAYGPNCETGFIHPTGVDLGEVVTEKFNEVSDRVKVPVYLSDEGIACSGPRDHLRPL